MSGLQRAQTNQFVSVNFGTQADVYPCYTDTPTFVMLVAILCVRDLSLVQ